MRNAFADELLQLGRSDDRIVLVVADIGNRLFDKFKAEFPDRFYNCGVAEANMTGLAAGMASQGLRPLTYTITPFATTRCLEQIRVDLCYHDLPVVVCGVGSGYSYGSLGSTHHACEDIAFLRSIPNMTVVCPGDPLELRSLLASALKWRGPVYLRMGKKGEPVVYPSQPELTIGKAHVLRSGADCCILSTGTILPVAMQCAREIGDCEVVSYHTVKPLDTSYLENAVARFPLIVTIEEHSSIGGLGSAVAEWMVDQSVSGVRLLRLGTPDKFIKDIGESEYIRHQVGLDADSVISKVRQAMAAIHTALH